MLVAQIAIPPFNNMVTRENMDPSFTAAMGFLTMASTIVQDRPIVKPTVLHEFRYPQAAYEEREVNSHLQAQACCCTPLPSCIASKLGCAGVAEKRLREAFAEVNTHIT